MNKLSLSRKPKSSPLRRVVVPMLAGAALVSNGACTGDVGFINFPGPEATVDGGNVDDAGPADPVDAGEEPVVGSPPIDVDGGEPGVDG